MKSIIGGLVAAAFIGLIAYAAIGDGAASGSVPAAGSNVVMESGTQVISIRAKGGYSPLVTTAKAGVPTIIRFETSGTFDCSSAVRIPSLGINLNLPPAGRTDVPVGELAVGKLVGTCGMGMYRFEVVAS